jgi:ribose/xylose/arabinose/galactoside ABC-type transport system permease subunit
MSTISKKIRGSNSNIILYLSILIFVVLFSILKPSFFSASNFVAILQSMASLCVLGIGATFILTVAEIDISNGAMMSIAPCVIALLITRGMPAVLGIAVALAVTLSLGLLNGVLVTKANIPSFIATLGVQGIAMGLTRTLTSNKPVLMKNDVLIKLFSGTTGGIQNIILWMFVLLAVGWFILYRTKFGRSLHCIGDNREAARSYGINVGLYVTAAFIVAACFVFFAGMMESLRSSYMRAGFGESLMLYSIVVALIGGSSVKGGKSNLIGTFIGALFVTMVQNGLFMLAMSSFMQNIIIGIIILAVLSANAVMENRAIELKRT